MLEKMIEKYKEEFQSYLMMHDRFVGEIKHTLQQKIIFDNQYSKSIYL